MFLTCPSAAAYEQTTAGASISSVDQADVAIGDTTIDVDDGTDFNVGDIVAFSTTAATADFDDGEEYRITSISTNELTIVQHPRGAGGLKKVVVDNAHIRRRWRYYDSVDGAPGTSAYVSDRSGSGDEIHVVVVDQDGGIFRYSRRSN